MPRITLDISERVLARWREIADRHHTPLEKYASEQVNRLCADPLRVATDSMLAEMDRADRARP